MLSGVSAQGQLLSSRGHSGRSKLHWQRVLSRIRSESNLSHARHTRSHGITHTHAHFGDAASTAVPGASVSYKLRRCCSC